MVLNALTVDVEEYFHAENLRAIYPRVKQAGLRYEDLVVDPPPLVRRRGDLEAGLRAYKDVNLFALRRLAPVRRARTPRRTDAEPRPA